MHLIHEKSYASGYLLDVLQKDRETIGGANKHAIYEALCYEPLRTSEALGAFRRPRPTYRSAVALL